MYEVHASREVLHCGEIHMYGVRKEFPLVSVETILDGCSMELSVYKLSVENNGFASQANTPHQHPNARESALKGR